MGPGRPQRTAPSLPLRSHLFVFTAAPAARLLREQRNLPVCGKRMWQKGRRFLEQPRLPWQRQRSTDLSRQALGSNPKPQMPRSKLRNTILTFVHTHWEDFGQAHRTEHPTPTYSPTPI